MSDMVKLMSNNVKLVGNNVKFVINNERGGGHIYIFGLMAIGMMTVVMILSLNVALHYANKDRTKPLIDSATHAASLDFNLMEASRGRLVWDIPSGTATFYNYFRKNLRLDASNNPLPGSYLTTAPIVHFLGFVTNPTYPYTYIKNVTVQPATTQETIRTIHTQLYGPSVVAIVEVTQDVVGQTQHESIVISSVSSIRRR